MNQVRNGSHSCSIDISSNHERPRHCSASRRWYREGSSGRSTAYLDTIQEHTNHGFDQTVIPCGGQHYQATGEEWAEGSFEFCRDDADAIFMGAIGYPGARLPNGDLAGGSVILGCEVDLICMQMSVQFDCMKGFHTKYMANSPTYGILIW